MSCKCGKEWKNIPICDRYYNTECEMETCDRILLKLWYTRRNLRNRTPDYRIS